MDTDDEDDDSDVVKPPVAPVRTVSRRAATKVRTYNLDGDEDISSGSDVEFKENTAVKGETVTTVVANLVSDSDDEPVVQTNNKQTAESMFDSLIGASTEKSSDNKMDDDDDDKEAKKSTEKRKRPPKVVSIESDSEDEAPIKKIRTKKPAEKKSKPAAKPKSKKKGSDSDDDFDFESERKKANDKTKLDTVTSRGGGRAKKPAKFVFDDSEDEMSD